ncbi:DUF2891 domain-containing protein [Crocinitomix catalasitica]|uniref:DUF2891 domain-containing protein n=1 Tax=Crocinitomix catalasitica TaxID=184607 RepID=UPI00056A0AF6|nr:DUF2891 domain-containing protein [Crocinitomix catalasitica]
MLARILGIALLFIGFTAIAQTENTQEVKGLDYDGMVKFAELPLHCIEQEYPYKLGQVLTDSTDLKGPKALHPIFYGCFDWHSSVHGHWLLTMAIKNHVNTPLSIEATALLAKQFTAEKVAAELAYFEPKLNKSFERTYGWAWILKLHASMLDSYEKETKVWAETMAPLTNHIVDAYKEFLPKLLYPIRVGEHTNTAFGLSLALDYARVAKDTAFEALIVQRAKDFYMEDKGCPLTWEPSGYDFISPCLQEAELMSKVLDEKTFNSWLKEFLPALFLPDFKLEPGKVLDRTDGKLVHLDGLNFSRAWCFYAIAKKNNDLKDRMVKLGDLHIQASKEQVVGSDYMGSHWLASFLVYALEARKGL